LKTYLFSIFVRFFLAFSGFLVFILTAYLYGAEGRGVIGYGTSLFAIFGSLLSFNLGRGFLAETVQDGEKKRQLIGSFLTLNFIFGMTAILAGLLYWYFSSTGREMLSQRQVLLFSVISVFYIWTANGNFFFSSFLKTTLQEIIILSVRSLLVVFLGALVLLKNHNLDLFIGWYAAIIFIGVVVENIFLLKISQGKLLKKIDFAVFWQILDKTYIHHIDNLAFNIFPLVLTVICAAYISKADVGRVNFAIQIINMVFLLALTANIRLMAYVSDTGFRARISQYKKLFIFTMLASAAAIIVIYFGLNISLTRLHFRQFEGVGELFLISSMAIPGYVFYQFLTPIWIELKKEKTLAAWHVLNFLVCLLWTPLILKNYQTNGVMIIFGFFYVGIFLIQSGMFFKQFILKPHV